MSDRCGSRRKRIRGKAYDARSRGAAPASERSEDLMRFIFGLAAAFLVSLGGGRRRAGAKRRMPASAAGDRRGRARGGGQGAQYEAAAQRQRGEIERTGAYARSIGCENRKFLFFGSNPPAQCEQINGQLSRMQANLADLQSRGGGADGGRAELVARYNSECADAAAFAAAFSTRCSAASAIRAADVQTVPVSARTPTPIPISSNSRATARRPRRMRGRRPFACAPATAVSSRSPIPACGRLEELQDMCRALCPNAEVDALHLFALRRHRPGGFDHRRALHGFADRPQISQERRQ